MTAPSGDTTEPVTTTTSPPRVAPDDHEPTAPLVPGRAPGGQVLDGPAFMEVGKPPKRRGSPKKS